MSDALRHWVRTQQDANIPLVQLQDPTPIIGPGLLVVTDDQRVALWSAANREHDRLSRGVWWGKWWGKTAIAATIVSGAAGLVASLISILQGR